MDEKLMELYRYRAETLKALANPTRLAIIDFLGDREKCVCHIVEYLGEKQSTISRHLATLRNAGIVESRKDGLNIYYRLKTPCVTGFFKCTDKILKEYYGEKDRILQSYDTND